jgi:hypothetical protein
MRQPASISKQLLFLLCSLCIVGQPVMAAVPDYEYQVPLEGMNQAVSQGQLTVTPGAYSFGTLVLGSSSATTVSVKNTGQDAVSITGFDLSAPFSQTNSCPSTLVGGASCGVTVTYNPQTAGNTAAVLSIATAEPLANGSFSVSGRAVVPTTNLAMSARMVDFGDADVGIPAGGQTLTVTNNGNSPATVTGVGVTGSEFNQSNNCGGQLAPGASCTVSLAFVPSAYGSRSGNLSLFEEASGTLYSAALTGSGNAPVLTLSPSALNLGSAIANYANTSAPVTVSNVGNKDVTGLSLSTGMADFAISAQTCGVTLAPGTSCTATIRFAPTAVGARSAALNAFTTNADAAAVALSGTGTPQAPSAAASAPSLSFGTVPVDGSSPAQQVTFSNTGNVDLSLGGVNIVAGATNYSRSTNCGATLAVGASCMASVTFSPRAEGAIPGTLRATFSSGDVNVALTGSGTLGVATLSPPSLSFADQQVGSTSAAKVVTVSNTGNRALTFTSIGVAQGAGDFAQSNNCATVAPGGTCTINVSFTPTATGGLTGVMSLTHDGVAGTTLVDLAGSGRDAAGALSTPVFPATPVGTSSTATATLSNTGIGALTVAAPSAASVSGAGYSFVSSTCGSAVAVDGNCTITVQFSPTTTNAAAGTLTLNTGAGSKSASFNTTGIQGFASLSPSSIAFAPQQISTTSAVQVVTLTNTGTAPLTVGGVGMVSGSSDFNHSNSCGSALAVGASCTISVSFTPVAANGRSGVVGFTTNGGGASTFAVSGTGVAAATGSGSFAPATVTTGSTATFTWSTANAVSASVACSGSAAGSWSGTSGSISVPTSGPGTGTCTVTATNSVGGQATFASNLTVVAAPGVSSASFAPSSVMAGGTATFNWSTTNATSASVTCAAPASGSSSGLSGSLVVSTSADGTGSCTVTASNAAGTSASGSANLTVTPAYTYSWQTSGYSTPSACGTTTATRSVWCERSDGATVADGNCGGGKPASSTSTTNYSSCSYSFQYGSWSSPSGCGNVTQTRTATCKRSDGTTVSNTYCGTPVTSQSGTSYSSCTYAFEYGSWSTPSGCGTVTETRTAQCRRSDGTLVSNSNCGTPVTTQSGTSTATCTYTANLGAWGTCSNSCGTGTQTRSVSCTRSDGATVANSNCGSPATSQSCTGNTGCAVKYYWSSASSTCSTTSSGTMNGQSKSGECTTPGATNKFYLNVSCGWGPYMNYTQTCQ